MTDDSKTRPNDPDRYDGAMERAIDWAIGQRSHWNSVKAYANPDDPISTTIMGVGCVIADALESIKWATLAQALTTDHATAISVGSAEQARKIVASFERNNLNVPEDLRRMAEDR
jgi:hypothetical protein